MTLSKKKFLRIYDNIRTESLEKVKQKDFASAINSFEILAHLAYNLNAFYSDDIIENSLLNLTNDLVIRKNRINPKKKKIIFYDSFGWDNRGLTQQYIRALISFDIEFLFIFENYNQKIAKNIIEELKKYPKATIYKLKKSHIQNDIIKLTNLIEKFEPSHAFLHLTPWSIVSIIVWNSFSDVTRYLINLTDHAFWLGKNSLDYCIEFRDYGANISKKHRNIPTKKIIKLPYYPVIKKDEIFQGFPYSEGNKTKIVSGGSYYKIFGKNDKFFKTLKYIAKKNKNIIIYFAGTGDSKTFNKLSKKYKLDKVLIPIGNRTDINEVIKNADIYLATYPITGGLMGQYAIKNQIPIIGYTDKKLKINYLESLCDLKNKSVTLTYFKEELFLKEITKMINDEQYKKNKSSELKDAIISVDDFNKKLWNIISYNFDENFDEIEIDVSLITDLYFEVENKYQKKSIKLLYANRKYFNNIKFTITYLYYLSNPREIYNNLVHRFIKKLKFINKIIKS